MRVRHSVEVKQQPAPSRHRSPKLADCARQPAQPPSPFLDGRKSVPSTARANMCASIGVTGYRGTANCPRRRAIALPNSRRLCAPASSAPSPFLDGRKSVPSTARANMCASIGVTGYRGTASCPRFRAIAPRHARRLCAPAGTVPSPCLDGRKSAASTARANMCTSISVTGYPKIGKQPAPSRHRFLTIPHPVRASRHSPITVSRWSKIGRLDRPRKHVCASISVTGYPRSTNSPRALMVQDFGRVIKVT